MLRRARGAGGDRDPEGGRVRSCPTHRGRRLHQRGRRALRARHDGLARLCRRALRRGGAGDNRHRWHRSRRGAGTHRLCRRLGAGLLEAARLCRAAYRAGTRARARGRAHRRRGEPPGHLLAARHHRGRCQPRRHDADVDAPGCWPRRGTRGHFPAGPGQERERAYRCDGGLHELRAERDQRHSLPRHFHGRSSRSRRGTPPGRGSCPCRAI